MAYLRLIVSKEPLKDTQGIYHYPSYDLHGIVTGKIGKIDGVVRTETFIELKTIQKEPIFEQQK